MPPAGSNPVAVIMSNYNNPMRTWYYMIDPELRLVHAFLDCATAKVAKKYNYLELNVKVNTFEDAKILDRRMADENLRICVSCWNREQGLCIKDKRQPRPGFKEKPDDWREPVKRIIRRTSRKSVTRD